MNFHVLIKTWTTRYSVLFSSLKLHKLPYLNLFIGFNNILKKIPFSCYIKCNTSQFLEKIYISFRKRIFLFFSFPFNVLNENEGKSKKYILAFSSVFIQNMEMKGKNTEKSFFLKKYIFFHWNGLYYILCNMKKRFSSKCC